MTKIDIISGFLGAGKTTFIKKMLQDVFAGEKVVLIENEFGEVGIDGGFLKDAGIEITEMNSGCICCSLVGDFGRNLREVLERFSPDRILIEPSGVGKLSDVMKSVKDVEDEQNVRLNGLITVVNTLKATKQMRAFGEFFNNQIEYATTIVLSRTQKATPEQLEVVVKAIREKNDQASIITTPWDELDGKTIYAQIDEKKSLKDELMAEALRHAHNHDHDHDHDEEHEHCCHDHDHDEEHEHCCHDHDHEEEHEHCHHDHDHEEEHEHCHHDHDHEEEHEHCHHDHDHEEHEHHEHDENCTCGCHGHHHDHEGHHHADDVFTSWGVETPHLFTRDVIEKAMKAFCDTTDYGSILRAKGMVPAEDGTWIYFDLVDGEYELRDGDPDYTGRLCVIGTDLNEDKLNTLFGL